MSASLLLGLLVIALAVVGIVKQYDVRLVLFVAALILGTLAGRPDAIVRQFLATFSNEQFVIPICTAMGFSYVLRLTGCDQHLVRLLVRPLVKVRVLLAPGTVLVGFLVNMPVVSQASTALAIGPVAIPILKAANVPAVTIGAALLIGSSIGGELFNPGAPELRTTVVESRKAAKTLDRDPEIYSAGRCIERLRPLNLLGLAVATTLFWWFAPKGELKGASRNDDAETKPRSESQPPVDLRVNPFKAAVPLVPIVLLAIFAPDIGFVQLPKAWLEDPPSATQSQAQIESDKGKFETRLIGAAMLVGVAVALVTSPSHAPKAAMEFFMGAGFGFANIVSIIVVARCFGTGLELIGIAGVLTEHLATDPRLLILVAGVSSLAFAVLCGSGMATAQSLFPFFAVSALEMGIDPTHVGAVVSLAAAAGRTMSPMAAVNQMCARLTDTKATDLSRIVAPPLLAGVAAILLAAMWSPPP